MNPFRKIALQGLKKNRTRTAVTIIGVMLSAGLITAIATFVVSLQAYLVKGAEVKYGGWHVGFPGVSASFLQEQAEDKRVEDVTGFENIGYAVLEGGKNPDKPYLFLAGFGADTFDKLPLELTAGRLPEREDEVIIPEHVAENGGVAFSVGDTLSLSVGERTDGSRRLSQHDPYRPGEEDGTGKETFVPVTEKTYTVVGFFKRPVFEEYAAPGYTAVTAVGVRNLGDSFTAIVTLKNPYQVRVYAKDADVGGGSFLNNEVLRFLGISGSQGFNVLLYTVGIVLVILVMAGSVFLIYNSFTISMNDRMRQFGVLLSVGATEKQLRKSVRFEAFCIGLVGIPLGILAGLPAIHLVLLLVSENFGNFLYDTVPLTVVLSLPAIAAAALVSMVTILVSAHLPAKKALKTPVMECIRQTNEVKVNAKDMKISGAARKLYGLEGVLALKNFRRNKGRYRSIVLSLTFSVVLFVSANAFGRELRGLTEGVASEANRNVVFVVDLFSTVFVIMISLIATANVFNTISTNIRLRRRELAMLRSVGMDERDFNKMMRFECMFYGTRTLLFGLPAAALCSWLIHELIVSSGMEGSYHFPWLSMGISTLGVFLIIFITMVYAVHKIKKENIIEALRDDMA